VIVSARDTAFRIERLPAQVAGVAPIDAAEAFRDLPGLALLDSARPGRRSRWSFLTADPVDVLLAPAAGSDPFADARRLLARMTPASAAVPDVDTADVTPPPFTGGLVGYLGYDVGLSIQPRETVARDDQGLPLLRLALHDWVVAWDRRTSVAWLAGRVVDGDMTTLDRRLADVRARLEAGGSPGRAAREGSDRNSGLDFVSNLDRDAFESRVEAVRQAIAEGEIYQANLSRRLQAGFDGDPWPLFRQVRTGDPALLAAYLDLGPSAAPARHPRAIVSSSPEPFLAVDAAGRVTADPIKGTRPRGRDRAEDRALARELMASAKDGAENTMIVDVLRNDLGRVCRPGSVRVPRLCRLERTAAVQHLVSTVTGDLAAGRDQFDLLAASFPGGSITGAPKLRAMEILEGLETVRRGPYTGALGWFGPDGAMATSILIRTFVADGERLSLNVGGGMTWRSDPAEEWDETVAKARGPLAAIGGREVAA
jgi:para-aminobenzoate synthetase component 1